MVYLQLTSISFNNSAVMPLRAKRRISPSYHRPRRACPERIYTNTVPMGGSLKRQSLGDALRCLGTVAFHFHIVCKLCSLVGCATCPSGTCCTRDGWQPQAPVPRGRPTVLGDAAYPRFCRGFPSFSRRRHGDVILPCLPHCLECRPL